MSKSMWEPSQACACRSGLAGVLALSLMRGDREVYGAACLEMLWHLAYAAHSQATLHPREGRLKRDPPGPLSSLSSKNQLSLQPGGLLLHAHWILVKSYSGGVLDQVHLCLEYLEYLEV